MRSQEQHKRSITKAVTFRIIVVTSDFIIITAITHQYEAAIGIIIVSNLASTILYYLHERTWNNISWGRK